MASPHRPNKRISSISRAQQSSVVRVQVTQITTPTQMDPRFFSTRPIVLQRLSLPSRITVIYQYNYIILIALILCTCFRLTKSSLLVEPALSSDSLLDNSIEHDELETHKHIDCGTFATNLTNILVKNPHYPNPTYSKSICETVIERADPTISRLEINFKQLELYRPTSDGRCMHDRFAVYTDLNAPVSPVLCGNHTSTNLTVPFRGPIASLIVSITTSDLDHDRWWLVEIEQAS